jgi:hypothetical protein
MPIHHHKSGGTTLTGDAIDFFALAQLRSGLGLELKGLRVSRGRTCYALAKRRYGLKGSRENVYAQLCRMVDEARAQQEHVDADGRRTVAGLDVQ